MQSFEAVKDVLNGYTLHDLQCIDVMKMLAAEKCLVCYDTGTGKTLMAAAAMKLLWRENPARKFIMFVKKDQLVQTPKKIEEACGRRVICSAADADSLSELFQQEYSDYSVLMLTHQCLLNNTMMNDLFQHRNEYDGVIVDEVHELSNKGFARGATVLAGLLTNFRYVFALTATPITTSVRQLASLASMIDAKRFPNPNKLCLALKNGKFDVQEEPCFFIERKGSDFGGKRDYRGRVEWVKPLPEQMENVNGDALFRLCKGPGSVPQVNALVKLLREYASDGKRGLVYVNQHVIREWVCEHLEKSGLQFECINGETKGAQRAEILERFNVKKELDVVVTSVTTAIDLDCDFVIFYELTSVVKQMIGRAHRGLGDKSLDVIFMITDCTNEVDFFVDVVLPNSKLLRDIMHKDIQEMEGAEKSVVERYAKN